MSRPTHFTVPSKESALGVGFIGIIRNSRHRISVRLAGSLLLMKNIFTGIQRADDILKIVRNRFSLPEWWAEIFFTIIFWNKF